MSFKDYLNEENLNEGKQFKDSSEATYHIKKIQSMIEDTRLFAWCRLMDKNHGTDTKKKMVNLSFAIDELIEELDSAA